MDKNKTTKNRREKTVGFVYVSVLFLIVTFVCCSILFHYTDTKNSTQKKFVIAKMDRVRQFQDIQNQQMVIIDSIYSKIGSFNPGINASYEENDIKFYLNDLKKIYDANGHDERYKIFQQVSGFYNMWFSDKKELWSKRQNIVSFQKNLEECQIGLDKKKEELKNTKR